MRIRHYWSGPGIFEFDETTGRVRRAGRHAQPDTWGIAWKQRWRWFVLKHDATSLYLQHRTTKWRLDKQHRFEVTGRFRRQFRIVEPSGQEFLFHYWFKGLPWAFIDPTYDGLDEETDDFFLHVVKLWRYWRDRPMSEFQTDIVDQAVPADTRN